MTILHRLDPELGFGCFNWHGNKSKSVREGGMRRYFRGGGGSFSVMGSVYHVK